MAKVMASMVLDRLPEHSGHSLQDFFHVHLALQGLGRELQNDSQITPLLFVVTSLLFVVVISACMQHVDRC